MNTEKPISLTEYLAAGDEPTENMVSLTMPWMDMLELRSSLITARVAATNRLYYPGTKHVDSYYADKLVNLNKQIDLVNAALQL